MSYPNDDPKAAWLWSFLLHSETTFTNRVNFFLVAESMLMVSYATVANATPPRTAIMAVIALLGLVFTVAWLYVNGRAVINMSKIVKKATEAITDYKEICAKRPGISANKVLGYVLPSLTLGAWIAIIILLWN